jgi:hypothetical protein
MKKINSIDFSLFKNNEHGQFHADVVKEIDTATPTKLGITPLYSRYSTDVTAEHAAIAVENGSKFTVTIEDSDLFRDQIYRGFVLKTEGNTMSYDPEVQDAAHNIMRVIDQVGDMRKQNYNQESETMASLITQLKSNYLADVTKCEELPLLNKLEETNNTFMEHFGERGDEAAARICGNVRLARIPVDEGFHNIANVVNAGVLINGEADYATFIDKINYLIDYHKNTIKIRRATRKASAAAGNDANPTT